MSAPKGFFWGFGFLGGCPSDTEGAVKGHGV